MTIDDLVQDIPRLHFWGEAWHVGGFDARALRGLHDLVAEVGGPQARVVETGAGASTLAFLLSGAARVTAVAPDAALFARIADYCARHGISTAALEPWAEMSEICLPGLAARHHAEETSVDLVLLDGGHGWPTVFVDFCYLNAMLRPGGLMVLDDIQLHSVKELARLLHDQPGYDLLRRPVATKTLVFRKLATARFLGDFSGQPYIVARTQRDEAMGKARVLD